MVNLPAESAKVKFYPGAVDKTRIKKEIKTLGYEASEKLTGQEALDREKEARNASNPISGKMPIIIPAVKKKIMS